MKILVDRSLQNEAGSKLAHPELYLQRLMLHTGLYAKSCGIMFNKFHIRFTIEP